MILNNDMWNYGLCYMNLNKHNAVNIHAIDAENNIVLLMRVVL